MIGQGCFGADRPPSVVLVVVWLGVVVMVHGAVFVSRHVQHPFQFFFTVAVVALGVVISLTTKHHNNPQTDVVCNKLGAVSLVTMWHDCVP